ncbi:MAG TPA: tetratricopeptide repeat protein [Legionella sp.]|nr:tetratricopeptide repeat protein [Legionella sp.]
MGRTQKGLEVTTDCQKAVASIDYFHQQILSAGLNGSLILDAAKSYPDVVLIQSYAAAFCLFSQENEASNKAKNFLMVAATHLDASNLREKLIYGAIVQWYKRDYFKAIELFNKTITLFPQDTLVLKFLEWLYYCTGQVAQAENFLRSCTLCAPYNNNDPYFLATYSFAMELSGEYERARETAEAAISLNNATGWAHHTLAHVYLLTNDMAGGIKRLNNLKVHWDGANPLLKEHNNWHLALFHLAQRNQEEVLALYPSVFGILPQTILEQIDAISLLWRLEMAGFTQDKLIYRVAGYLEKHPFEYFTGFNNAHFIYGLVKSGQKEQAKKSLDLMKKYIGSLPINSLWKEVFYPWSKAIYAFSNEDYRKAEKLIAPVIGKYTQLGGSDAQTELFTQTYLLSLIRSGQQKAANVFFKNHLSHYKNTALAEWWFT